MNFHKAAKKKKNPKENYHNNEQSGETQLFLLVLIKLFFSVFKVNYKKRKPKRQ